MDADGSSIGPIPIARMKTDGAITITLPDDYGLNHKIDIIQFVIDEARKEANRLLGVIFQE